MFYSRILISRRSINTNQMRSAYYSRKKNTSTSSSNSRKTSSTNISAINDINKLTSSLYGNYTNVKNSDESISKYGNTVSKLEKNIDSLASTGVKSVFTKTKEIKDENTSKVYYDYNKDKITNAIKEYVNDYNNFIELKDKISSSSYISKYSNYLMQACQSRISSLNDFGISFDTNNKMVLDEEKFKKADMDKVNKFFTDKNSYGQKIKERSELLSKAISSEVSALSSISNSTYSSNGRYLFNK